MKILIIEDDETPSVLMAEALQDLGEVTTFLRDDRSMPSMEEIKAKIAEADVVLLDNDLRTSYEGRDLLPFCTGKIVIGTSTMVRLGTIQFTEKNQITMGSRRAAQTLRELVSRELGIGNV